MEAAMTGRATPHWDKSVSTRSVQIVDEMTRELKGTTTAKLQMPQLSVVHRPTYNFSEADRAQLFELLVCELKAYDSV